MKDIQIKDTKQKSLVEVKLLLRETAIEMARSMETKPNQSLSSIIESIEILQLSVCKNTNLNSCLCPTAKPENHFSSKLTTSSGYN